MPNALRNGVERASILFSCADPRLTLLGDFLSAEECRDLIDLASPKISRSHVVDDETGLSRPDSRRTSDGVSFDHGVSRLVDRIDRRVEALLGAPVAHQEPLQVLRYGVGGEYEPHFDYFHENLTETEHFRGGQRIATLVMYLNEIVQGGGTIFPEVRILINPRPGNAIYFENVDDDGDVMPSALHGGTPVGKGEKWIATKWIRQDVYRA